MSKVKGKTREEIINNLADRIDKFEKYSTPHSQAIADIATHLARRLGLSQSDVKAIAEAARLHDIGLYAMSPAYHSTAAALRFEERLDLWRHSIIGEQEMAKRESSRYAQLLVRWHHECWNGSGYPDMLAFEDIPIGARILRAVELYNSLICDRPYRLALSKKAALEVLQASAGIECDPYIVYALLALLKEMGADEDQQVTVLTEETIQTATLAEIKAEDAVDTLNFDAQTETAATNLSSQDQQQTQEGEAPSAQQNDPQPTHQDNATGSASVSSTAANDSVSLLSTPVTSVWTTPSTGTPPTSSMSVWTTPEEASSPEEPSSPEISSPSEISSSPEEASSLTQTASNESTTLVTTPLAPPVKTPPAVFVVEAATQNTVSESFFESPNPLDASDALQNETPAGQFTSTPQIEVAQTSPTGTPSVDDASVDHASVDDASVDDASVDASLTSSPVETSSASQDSPVPVTPTPVDLQVSVTHTSSSQRVLFQTAPQVLEIDDSPNWLNWKGSKDNQKSLLAFEASVLRQVQFNTVAIAFSAEAKLDWYLKAWNKRVIANDSRAWAAMTARAFIESTEALSEEHIAQLLQDIYIPGTRLSNPNLRRWFSETDAWWMDNLRRNIEALEDPKLRAQACVLGLQTGDYALSFDEETYDLRRPLTTVFWRLAGRLAIGAQPHPQNRSYNYKATDFIRNVRADLLYLNLPASQPDNEGSQARADWRECWVKGLAADAEDFAPTLPSPQSKQAYLFKVDEMFRAAAHLKKWAIGCQEIGLVSARDISELVKEHRNVRATYSKDVTEVAGGARSYIIIAERD